MKVNLVDDKQDKPMPPNMTVALVITNKTNQTTKYDGGIGDVE